MHHLLSQPKTAQWLIFAIACLIYANTIPNKWAIDDSIVIHQNTFVKRGVAGIGDIFSCDAFAGFYGRDVNALAGGRYRPLTPALFAVQAEVFAAAQKDANQELEKDKEGYKIKDLTDKTWVPNVLHFFNMLWYGLLCLVMYRTLLLLFNPRQEAVHFKANFMALATTLLYAVHPLHTEAVANVKGLDEILAMLGALASLYAVLKVYQTSSDPGAAQQKQQWWLGAALTYGLALFAKESALTFIAIIPLALWFFTEASAKTIAKLMLPLMLPLVLFLGIRSAVLYPPNKGPVAEELMNDPFLVLDPAAQYAPLVPGSSIQKLINPNANTFRKMPYAKQLATNVYTWGVYLKLLVAPYPLTVDYYPRHIAIKSFADPRVLLSLLIHLLLLGWALLHTRQKNPLAFGILYYFLTFSIVSNLFFPIGTNMAERFMFMPSLGFCIVLAGLLYALGNSWSTANTNSGFSKIYLALGFILVVFSGLTIKRNFAWKDNFTLFSKDIEVSKNSGKIHNDLAGELINKAIAIKEAKEKEIEDLSVEAKKAALKATDQERADLISRAIPLLTKALEIHPLNNSAWLQMANAHHFLGQLESNIPNVNLTYLNTALAAYDLADYYKAAGMDTVINKFKSICCMDIGKVMGQQFGDNNTAIRFFEKAQTLAPKNAEVYLLLGTAHSMLQQYDKAIEYTHKSLELRPKDRDTKQNLAVAYQQYALADASKRALLPLTEKLLLEVYSEVKKLQDNDVLKKDAMLRVLDLLYKNYKLQGNSAKAEAYKKELLKLNSLGK